VFKARHHPNQNDLAYIFKDDDWDQVEFLKLINQMLRSEIRQISGGARHHNRRKYMSYKNAFITISDDSDVHNAIVPLPKNHKPTIASIEYDLISKNPYKYTQEDVQFYTYLIKNNIEFQQDKIGELRDDFFKKPKACFRASPLVKKFGWGIHYDDEGKIALYPVNSEDYSSFLQSDTIKIIKGMRSKRK